MPFLKSLPSVLFIFLTIGLMKRTSADETAEGLDFFESKIRPVLVEHCYPCHSAESGKSKGGLLLDSSSAMRKGGDSGPAVVPLDLSSSVIVGALKYETFEMPPKGKLAENIVADIEAWIEMGAPDPRHVSNPAQVQESIDIQAGRSFWAFQPRRKFGGEQSIDGLVDPSSPRATNDQLVRRLFLDLIGLPPTPTQRREFLRQCEEDSVSTAIDKLIDQLLSQREFGEKWARHWLDVARYADSNGGDFNLTFHQAWRYRNYVIDVFNDDVPYDRFVREQIAGDLLPFDTPEQRNRQLVATGFLMVAAKMLTERDKAKMHLDIADEQLDTIGRSMMGMTLGCARCHDHKFDPIPTSDYYAMAGILHSTRTADRVLMNNVNVTGWTESDLLPDAQTQKLITTHRSKIAGLEETLKVKEATALELGVNDTEGTGDFGVVVDDPEAERVGPWRQSTYRPNHIGSHYLATDKDKGPYSITWKARLPQPGKYELRVSFGGGKGLAKSAGYVVRHVGGETRVAVDQTVQPSIAGLWQPIGQFNFDRDAEVSLTDKNAGGHVIADAIQLVSIDQLNEAVDRPGAKLAVEIRSLKGELEKLREAPPKVPQAMAAMDNAGSRMGDLNIRIRGETTNLGPKVHRGFLQVASDEFAETPSIRDGQSGRVELAEWLTNDDHPLTARVMANRIWQQLFGRGLVATVDNFGVRGTPPSHPELLDYLAERFVAGGWSMKSLIREIVRSKTYQQSVGVDPTEDPENNLLQRQNRRPVPAETMRDSILAIAGQLDRRQRESVVKQLDMYAIATSGARHESLGQTAKLRQRSIYLPMVRGAVPPSLAVFDFPNPDLVTGRRAVTTVPTQALFMMNSPLVREMSLAVGSQFTIENVGLEKVIDELYQRILVRDADAEDIVIGEQYIKRTMDHGKSSEEAIALFVQVLFSSTEFRFVE